MSNDPDPGALLERVPGQHAAARPPEPAPPARELDMGRGSREQGFGQRGCR